MEEYTKQAQAKMEDNLSAFRARARKIRTGRARPSLVESISVLYYGNQTPLGQMAHISAPSARALVISPWDLKALKDVEQALSPS